MAILDQVLQRIDDDLPASLDRLFALLRIESISTDPAYRERCAAAADWLVGELKGLGFDAAARPTRCTSWPPPIAIPSSRAPAGTSR